MSTLGSAIREYIRAQSELNALMNAALPLSLRNDPEKLRLDSELTQALYTMLDAAEDCDEKDEGS